MKLEMGNFRVEKFSIGNGGTRLEDGVLNVDEDEVRQIVLADNHFGEVRLYPVYPGDSTRIIHAMGRGRAPAQGIGARYGVSGHPRASHYCRPGADSPVVGHGAGNRR